MCKIDYLLYPRYKHGITYTYKNSRRGCYYPHSLKLRHREGDIPLDKSQGQVTNKAITESMKTAPIRLQTD